MRKRRIKRRLRRRIAEILVALVTIVGGVGLAAAGIAGPAPRQSEHRYLTPDEARYADLDQQLRIHEVCMQTGQWDTWPCDRFTPPAVGPTP